MNNQWNTSGERYAGRIAEVMLAIHDDMIRAARRAMVRGIVDVIADHAMFEFHFPSLILSRNRFSGESITKPFLVIYHEMIIGL